MEIAEVLCGPTTSRFDWSNPAESRFYLWVEHETDPIEYALRFLAECDVLVDLPMKDPEIEPSAQAREPSRCSSVPPHTKRGVAPVFLATTSHRIRVDYWADASSRDRARFWSPTSGVSGLRLVSDALKLARSLGADGWRMSPLQVRGAAAKNSAFQVDPRRDYTPLQVGFSLYRHQGSINLIGYPLVEVLAAVGLSHSRPRRVAANAYCYSYEVCGASLPASLQRAALGTGLPGFESRGFRIQLEKPGEKSTTKTITSVTETTTSNV